MPEDRNQEVKETVNETVPQEQQARRPLTDKERAMRQHQRDMEFLRRKQMIRESQTKEERERVYNSIHYNHVVEEPKTFSKKVENFWYHYRITIIIVAALAGIVFWFLHDMITNTKYDINMGIFTFQPYYQDYVALSEEWTPYLEDYNNDGESHIMVLPVEYDIVEGSKESSSVDYNEIMASTTHLAAIFDRSSRHYVLLMDQNYYDYFIERGLVFTDLSELSDAEGVEGDKFYVKDHPAFALFEGKDDCFFVLRHPDTIMGWDAEDEEMMECYDQSVEYLKNLMDEKIVSEE